MDRDTRFSRRTFLVRSGTLGLGAAAAIPLSLLPHGLKAAQLPLDVSTLVRRIADADIRAGLEAAVFKNLIPAATERVYPGHFTINADGGGFGSDTTWPGLDSWQMIGPYLQLGHAHGPGLFRFCAGVAAEGRQHPIRHFQR